ncbi:MAG: hypothetical protein CL927_21050 [Deltaproteobacteria bacterium]|nr:hypothetical protein [Deltaproteobacteria bacterium]
MVSNLRGAVLMTGLLGLLSSPALAGPKEDAKRLYGEAKAAWEVENDPGRAAELFQQSYVLHPHPGIALAVARTSLAAQRYESALDAYALYEQEKARMPASLRVDVASEIEEARLGIVGKAPAEVAENRTSPGGASERQVERLQAIVDQLTALSVELQATATEATVETAPIEAVPPTRSAVAAGGTLPTTTPELDIFSEETRSVSRYGQPLLEAPATVTVLTAEDIRMSGASNVPDVLRRVVGVDVMQLSAAQPDLSIRGFNRALANKVLVLVDGRSVYQDILATPIWATIPVMLEEIERIEVVRGPASAVYGANAVTGVVNIITRAPGTGSNLVHLEGGGPGYSRGTVVTTGRHGDLATRLSAGFQQAGRWSTNEPVLEDGPYVSYFDDPSRALGVVMANGRVDRRLGEVGSMSLSAGYSGGISEFYVFGRMGDFGLDFDSAYARADLSVGPIHVRSFYNKFVAETGPFTRFAGEESLPTFVDSDTVDGEVEFIQQFEGANVDHHIVGGVGYRFKKIAWGYLANDGANADEHHARVFIQEEAALGDFTKEGWRPFRLVGSLRFDRHPLVDDPLKTFSPRGAAVWRFHDRRSARITSGTAFRAPSQMESYLELYQPVEGANGYAVQTLGDQSLLPERVFTVEAGIHDESSDIHSADVTVYMNEVRDLIGLTDVDGSQFTDVLPDREVIAAGATSFTNVEGVYRGFGAELEGRLYPVRGLDLYGNVALGRISQNVAGTVLPESSMSTVKVNAGVVVRTPWRTDLATHVHYLSDQSWAERDFNESGQVEITDMPIPGRTVLVAKVAAHPLANEDLELAMTGWNLLALAEGGSFQEHPLGQDVGARWFGSATWRF